MARIQLEVCIDGQLYRAIQEYYRAFSPPSVHLSVHVNLLLTTPTCLKIIKRQPVTTAGERVPDISITVSPVSASQSLSSVFSVTSHPHRQTGETWTGRWADTLEASVMSAYLCHLCVIRLFFPTSLPVKFSVEEQN